MASKVIYPPIVNSYMPAFVVKKVENTDDPDNIGWDGACKVYFSLSKFNSRSDFKSVHVSITKQGSGVSVVNKENNAPRYRATGIILNVEAKPVLKEGSTEEFVDNLYYIDITSEDIEKKWTPGWIYKIQIRLSEENCEEADAGKQQEWLNKNGNKFSEWSTVCTIKAIGENQITITLPTSIKQDPSAPIKLNVSTLNISGTYSNIEDKTESLYSYKVKLLKDSILLEESDILYPNQYIKANQFDYLFKQELDNGNYTLILEYETNNKYVGKEEVDFSVELTVLEDPHFYLLVAETGAKSTIYSDEEEGRIGLQIEKEASSEYTGDLCIRRTSELSDFKEWEDIKIISYDSNIITDSIVIYDYTAVSGIRYHYGIQSIDKNGNRSPLNIIKQKNDNLDLDIVREYQFSYLLGENEQQLKLKFDNNVSSFKITVGDAKVDTIGGRYPFITRNGNMYYKTFQISGIISYNMDESFLFFKPKEIKNNLYDYTYERTFRDKVFNFLCSGKPKLFKSPTEGNILVRLMDVSATPNQNLSRMIYSFSANAVEIDDFNLKNCIANNLTSLEYKKGE